MSGGVYGGDEVGALVFDAGHYSFRAGYAGEDCPKAEIPSGIGYIKDASNPTTTEAPPPPSSSSQQQDENRPPQQQQNASVNGSASGSTASDGKKYYIDTNSIHVPRAGMEIGTFLKDGMIDDWDMFEAVVEYTYRNHLLADPTLHPLLMSEASWNTKLKREQLTEMLFEKYSIPAFYLCKTAVLAAFANGRASGLVVDSGATHTSAIPVYEGYCLTQAIVKSPIGGDAVTAQCRQFLEEQKIEVVPRYLIASKEAVGERQPANWTKRANLPEVTKSFHSYMVKEVVQDFQSTVLQASDTPFDSENAEKVTSLHYEFPNGYNQDFVSERLQIAEGLFDPTYLRGIQSPTLSVTNVISTSINMCDIDIRPSLYGGIIVTGGNTLLPGFVERLTHDLNAKCPANAKLKLFSAPSSSERRFGSWIGGSILASLGSFQQMWISKQEYDESGKSIIEKKCP